MVVWLRLGRASSLRLPELGLIDSLSSFSAGYLFDENNDRDTDRARARGRLIVSCFISMFVVVAVVMACFVLFSSITVICFNWFFDGSLHSHSCNTRVHYRYCHPALCSYFLERWERSELTPWRIYHVCCHIQADIVLISVHWPAVRKFHNGQQAKPLYWRINIYICNYNWNMPSYKTHVWRVF